MRAAAPRARRAPRLQPCNTPLTPPLADLVARLSTPEKLGLLTNSAQGVPRLFIPPYQWHVAPPQRAP